MRRTKEWWAALEPEERSTLVGLERAEASNSGGTGFNLPEGYSCCPWCSYPKRGCGVCFQCLTRLQELIAKADRSIAMQQEKKT